MLKIQSFLEEMRSLLDEATSSHKNISEVLAALQEIETRYHSGKLTYKEFISAKSKLLKNRTRETVVESYEKYYADIVQRLQRLTKKVVNTISNDTSYNQLQIGKHAAGRHLELPAISELEVGEVEMQELHRPKPSVVKQPEQIKAPKPEPIEAVKPPTPVPLNFWNRLVYAFQAKEKPWLDEDSDVRFGGIFSKAFLRYLLAGKSKERDIFGNTTIMPSILTFEDKAKLESELQLSRSEVLDPYLLERQIKELKSLLSKKKPEVYKASTIGYLANITVRRISIYFIEKYPDLFRKLYTAIRHSNIRILANTYINIVFFLTILSGITSIPLFTMFFTLQGNSPGFIIVKTLFASLVATNLVFWIGFYYPFMRSNSRRSSINTNLPFAIDHMSSVIASGVSPATMFKLISRSKEYGQISVEVEKITHYVEFFGYDILTAIKAVALTTPSDDFKEFLDGFVSTIETGGDLTEYLSQKSSEALLNYRLERQKYVESLSTYSDLYTGVLIAAPLFFVTALSLVSAFGGSIGSFSINTIITVGTYLAIPGLNILFLVFLEINQPEI